MFVTVFKMIKFDHVKHFRGVGSCRQIPHRLLGGKQMDADTVRDDPEVHS